MNDRAILDLCGGTGAWSQPYRDAGYMTLVVDPQAPELPHGQTFRGTVQEFNASEPNLPHFHGVLIAPPCTEFASSGARWWKDKSPELYQEAVRLVMACLWTVAAVKPKWWALENPIGRLRREIGPPRAIVSPCEYGESWSKRTCLWGEFNLPPRQMHDCEHEFWGWRQLGGKSERTKRLRSETSPAFAKAFFWANT